MLPIRYRPPQPVQTSAGSSGGGFLSKVLPAVGAVTGAALGSVVPVGGTAFGTAAGASLGATLGSIGGGLVAEDPKSPTYSNPKVGELAETENNSAMQRRQEALDNTPLRQIRESLNALKQMPPEYQAEFAKPLLMAEYMAKQKGNA